MANVVTILQSGSYTVPAGVRALGVLVIGGGGGGGGGSIPLGILGDGGGGGGSRYRRIPVAAGEVYTVSLGGGGDGGETGDDGVAGSESSFSGTFGSIVAPGGGGAAFVSDIGIGGTPAVEAGTYISKGGNGGRGGENTAGGGGSSAWRGIAGDTGINGFLTQATLGALLGAGGELTGCGAGRGGHAFAGGAGIRDGVRPGGGGAGAPSGGYGGKGGAGAVIVEEFTVPVPVYATITPNPGIYAGAGTELEIALEFSHTMTVAGGVPAIVWSAGPGMSVNFNYYTGSGESDRTLHFLCNSSVMGGSYRWGSIALNGATIRDIDARNADIDWRPPGILYRFVRNEVWYIYND